MSSALPHPSLYFFCPRSIAWNADSWNRFSWKSASSWMSMMATMSLG